MNARSLNVLVAAAAMTVGVLAAPASASALQLVGKVSDVVDGDTIKVVSRGAETPVRLIGIDTPETRHPSKPVQCFGPAASARAKRLLPKGQRVRLITDPTQDTRDRYGRLLAYVYKPGKKGARGSVNFAMVATGYAKTYVYGGVRFRHATQFFRAQSRARKAKKGLWGKPCNGNTTKPDPSSRPAPAPRPSPSPGGGNCDPNYSGACVPRYPPDVDCADIGRPVRVVGSDPHRLDGDGDGHGCESY